MPACRDRRQCQRDIDALSRLSRPGDRTGRNIKHVLCRESEEQVDIKSDAKKAPPPRDARMHARLRCKAGTVRFGPMWARRVWTAWLEFKSTTIAVRSRSEERSRLGRAGSTSPAGAAPPYCTEWGGG